MGDGWGCQFGCGAGAGRWVWYGPMHVPWLGEEGGVCGAGVGAELVQVCGVGCNGWSGTHAICCLLDSFPSCCQQPPINRPLLHLSSRSPAGPHRYLEQQMPARILAAAAAPAATAIDVLAAALAAAPTASLRKFVAVRTAGSATHGGVCVQTAVVRTFLTELRSMPLFGELAAALPQWRQQCGGGVDELVATNCYTPGSAGCGDDSAAVGCCGPAPSGPRGVAVGVEAAAQLQQQTDRQQHAGQLPEQEQTQQQAGRQQTWQQPQEQQQTEVQQAEQGGGQEALCAPPGPLPSSPSADLRATAAAASSPALAASAAEPAVREDLSLERACMLLLMAPRELWRGIPDERLRGEVLALLDASSHAGL